MCLSAPQLPSQGWRLKGPPLPGRRDWQTTPAFLGLPRGLDGTESACSAGDPGSIPGLGRSPGEGNGNPLQRSCLENPRDGGAWWAAISGVAQSRTRLKRLSSSSRTGAYRPMDGPRSRQGNADLQQGSHQRVITGTAAARVCSCREPQLRVASTGDPLMLP